MEANRLESVTAWLKTPKRQYIGGEWVEGKGSLFSTFNPANGALLAEFAESSREDVDLAASAAAQAFRGSWKRLPRAERARKVRALGQVMRDHAAELATLESLNNGKTYREALIDDLPESADVFDYYAGWIDKIYGETCPVEKGFVNFTRREPVGVCALVVPWNFPLLMAAWKLAPALAMGNTVVLKPSPFTSLSVMRFVEWVHEAGILPPGVLNLVLGGSEAGEALAQSSRIQKIAFTGSTAVGKKIVEAAGHSNLKTVSLELGGKSPNILFDDIKDIDAVVSRSFTAMFSHKGEKCSEPTRFLIQEGIYDQVAERLAQKAAAVICGDPFDPKTQQGAQCHQAHFNKILDYIEIGKSEGAKLIAGGGRDTQGNNADGLFVRPTVFGDVTQTMRIAREEIFGPVLCLMRFRDDAEAIRIANDTDYGLAAGLYTADAARAHRVANELEAGIVFVNHYGCYDFSSPFGGIKQSGWGSEMGIHSLEAYTRMRSIWVRYE